MATDGLACMAMFGEVRGAEIVDLVERTTGALCPCKRGLICPLMPKGMGAA